MGRTSFVIDPVRLKALRLEADLTQLKLISKAYAMLKRSRTASDKTLISHYQRIEKYGHTSSALANALAKVLDTTVDVLQGKDVPETYNYVDKIVKQLKAQLEKGGNAVLENEIVKHESTYGSQPPSRDEVIRNLAEDIGISIEMEQLIGHETELAKLRSLTGWSNEQMLNPANVHGYWFVRSTVKGNQETRIIYGLTQVEMEFYRVLEDIDGFYHTDMRISIRHQNPWISINIDSPSQNEYPKSGLMFTRALPKPDGLRWISPSESDKWRLNLLNDAAFRNANFVTLDDATCHPVDVRNLRLMVVECVDGFPGRVAYTAGRLPALPDHIFESFRSSGSSHGLVVSWLTNGLAKGLRFCLTNSPEGAWKVRASQGAIMMELDIMKLPREQRQCIDFFSYAYKITLVEALPNGQYSPAPWAQKSIGIAVKNFAMQLQREWETRNFSPEEDEVVLHFTDIKPQDELPSSR